MSHKNCVNGIKLSQIDAELYRCTIHGHICYADQQYKCVQFSDDNLTDILYDEIDIEQRR